MKEVPMGGTCRGREVSAARRIRDLIINWQGPTLPTAVAQKTNIELGRLAFGE
jgi:hypothetical protein